MEVTQVSKGADVWIEESKRPYAVSVNELMEASAARKFHVDVEKVEAAVANAMLALEGTDPDTLLAALSVMFLLMVRSFGLKLCSVLQFAENYICGNDRKLCTQAWKWTLNDDYERHVMRYETVKLSRAINATEILNAPKQ